MKKTLLFFIATFLLVSFQFSNGLIKTENFPQKNDVKANLISIIDEDRKNEEPIIPYRFGKDLDVNIDTKAQDWEMDCFSLWGNGTELSSDVVKSSNQSCEVNFTWQGMGPHGQVDIWVTGGSSPYKVYNGRNLIFTSYQSFFIIQLSCSVGGLIRVEANTPCGPKSSSLDIVPPGCASF